MKEQIDAAIKVLKEGGVILYPTDTIWGLGCDATNPEAVEKIFKIKQRSDSKSLITLVADLDMVGKYVKEIPEIAVQLVEVNDKPMTIIYPGAVTGPKPDGDVLPKAEKYALAFNTVAEDGSVGMRIPMMEFCRQLVFRLGRPIVSTSANISGEATPKKFAEISQDVKSAVDHIVDPALERGSTGQSSSIIKVGLDYSIEIIRK